MQIFVKICGLCSAEQVRAVAALGPDALGFVFWPRSKRHVLPAEVAAWTADLPPGILKVGVFVDAGPAEVAETARVAGLDVAQWHNFQSLEKRPAGVSQVWKVADPAAVPAPDPRVDAYLLDRYSADSPGGTGMTCAWARAAEFVRAASRPVILAGGLNPENVRAAIQRVRPWGVDVSSGVEERPGVKDLRRVREFINQCRNM